MIVCYHTSKRSCERPSVFDLRYRPDVVFCIISGSKLAWTAFECSSGQMEDF